ncbi:MAG: hypothetical protein AAGF12_42215 [Myxococcota bacterium]
MSEDESQPTPDEQVAAAEPRPKSPPPDLEPTALGELFVVLDRLPFVASLKRDIRSLRELLYQRRAPRLAIVGPDRSARLSFANALLNVDAFDAPTAAPASDASPDPASPAPASPDPASSDPAPSDPASDERVGWLRLTSDTARLELLDLADDIDLGELDAPLGEAAPDTVLLVLTPESLHGAPKPRLRRASKVVERMRQATDDPMKVLAVVYPSDSFARPEGDHGEALALGTDRFRQMLGEAGFGKTELLSVGSTDADEDLVAVSEKLFGLLPEAARLEGARCLPRASRGRRDTANAVVRASSTIALTVGMAPVPMSDAILIAPLQVMMVSAVAHLGGKPWDKKAALQWIGSMGVVGGAGFGFRWTAQQLLKLIPGAGMFVSAGVAGAGTVALGQSAIAYFLRAAPKELPADA